MDLKQETSSFVGILVFYEQLKFRAHLSWAWKKFYNLGAWTLHNRSYFSQCE